MQQINYTASQLLNLHPFLKGGQVGAFYTNRERQYLSTEMIILGSTLRTSYFFILNANLLGRRALSSRF